MFIPFRIFGEFFFSRIARFYIFRINPARSPPRFYSYTLIRFEPGISLQNGSADRAWNAGALEKKVAATAAFEARAEEIRRARNQGDHSFLVGMLHVVSLFFVTRNARMILNDISFVG